MAFVFRLAVTLCTGPIPEELGALSQLKELRLSGNKLTGEHEQASKTVSPPVTTCL